MAERCEYLPDECWELIVNRLDSHTHLEPLSLACKRFLSITDSLRTHFRVVDSTIFIHSSLSKLFHRFPHVRSIDLSGFRGDLDRVILEIAVSDLNLQALDVSHNDRLPLEGLKLLGSNMNSLRVLNCSDLCTFCDVDLVTIADSVPSLEELDISYPRHVLYAGIQLQTLRPGEVGVTDSGIQALSRKLRGLRKINLSGNEFISDKSLVALSSNCVLLEEIAVLNCSLISEYGIQRAMLNSPNLSSVSVMNIRIFKLTDSLASARNLSALDIHESVVSDECFHSLAKAGLPLKRLAFVLCSHFNFSAILLVLCAYQSLEYLALIGGRTLTDKGMRDLSKYLRKLIIIRLKFCSRLTSSTLFTLAKNCPFLEEIDMEMTNLGGGGDFNVDIGKNARIKSLQLGSNLNLSDECLRKLASICPSLELLDVSSCSSITGKGISEFLKSNSMIRYLRIDECGKIKNIETGFALPKMEVLRAARSGIDDEGLVTIGNRCGGLLNLDLQSCYGVTTVGLREMIANFKRLREINLSHCRNVSELIVDWMVFSVPSLRKIVPPFFSCFVSESQRNLFLRHGCVVCEG